MTNNKQLNGADVFFSPSYVLVQICTLTIFFLGFKWTLFGLYWIPPLLNPVLYTCVALFWLYYNYLWIRTALYLPSTYLAVINVYADLGVKKSALQCFYIALCKLNRARKAELKMRRENKFIRMAALSFVKIGILANMRRTEAKELSKAIFIHTKKSVIDGFRFVLPYFAPTFAVILILTPLIVLLSSHNYRYLIEHFIDKPVMISFWVHIILLPFKLIWVFMTLSTLAANIISPLLTLPFSKVFAKYVKENHIELDLKRKHHLPVEGLVALFMILTALVFYVSILLNILL
ncbi:hypothetical protein [Candidatus Proelusimicrobium volucris]|uniref:hypothetical protein n=1 Tax=Candidatus Proelusimicrobium volucris TaxID=3416225 RepID=UPI003D0EF505